MRTRKMSLFLLLAACLTAAFVTAQDKPPRTRDEALKDRRALAESGTLLYQAPVPGLPAAAPSDVTGAFGDALDIPPAILTNASTSGSPAAIGILPGMGVIRPRRGPTFVVLSTGIAGTMSPQPGTDFPPFGTSGDRATLTLTLNLPPGASRLSFDFNFLSTEYPEWVGSIFDDRFSAVLTDSSGVREIARSSVNSTIFIPVSASNAGGSGFDIFSPVLPDAGLTGFQFVSVPVTGGGPATLTFSIEDAGDGILDSAVILDNVLVSSMELVDPYIQLQDEGGLIVDPEQLARYGHGVNAAAADGVTRVLLRASVDGPGVMEFCLLGAASPADGSLLLVGGTGRGDCVATPAVSTTEGFRAFAVYLSPLAFNRGGDELLKERSFEFSSRFTPAHGDIQESKVPFKLVRPPVVLFHGLWSHAGIWTFPLVNDARFSIEVADYTPTNAEHFFTNAHTPEYFILSALTRGRLLNGTAATQADVAGHSMGGILSRIHTTLPDYKNIYNFHAGDIHTLSTLDTPHTGSPIANVMQGLRSVFGAGLLFERLMDELGRPINRGAIEDVAEGSEAILGIAQAPVPGHALVGIGGLGADLGDWLGAIYTVINAVGGTVDVFRGLENDGLVPRLSQEGGMPGRAISVFGGPESMHPNNPSGLSYSNRLIELFNSSPTGPLFAEFPAPSTLHSSSLLGSGIAAGFRAATAAARASTTSSLTITSPADGTQVASGQTVHVTLSPGGSPAIDRVVLVGPGAAQTDAAAPFEIDFAIPAEADGEFPLLAVGHDSSGGFAGSNTVTLRVVPAAALTSVRLLPRDPFLFAIGDTRAMTVLGDFDDGVARDISRAATGTVYYTSDATIADVSSEGVVSAVGRGGATIVARNGSVQDSVSVRIELANDRPVADAGPDQTVAVGSAVTLDGTKSSDPDGGPGSLTFSWKQIAGPAVSLADARTASPTFTAALAGSYTFSLVVSDGAADSTPDSVTVRAGLSALTALGPARMWIGLKNGDDAGTQFDLKVEVLKNGTPVASSLKRCISGVARNPASAKDTTAPFDSFAGVAVSSGDVLALKVSTRIGTTPGDAKCAGPGGSHNSAVGLRLYYDAASRASRFAATITPDTSKDLYLHSDGSVCGSTDSTGVTTRSLDANVPAAANAKCKDSGTVNFSGGNPFSTIGTWSLAPLP